MAHDTIIEEDPCLRKIPKEPVTNEVQMLLEEMVSTDMKLYDRANQLFSANLSGKRNRWWHFRNTIRR
jgi:hypothetical protein